MKKGLTPELTAEWDREKNGIPPESVTYGSKKNVWWRCPRGHSYMAPVYSRSAGCGCPYCAGKRAIPGETDLATTNPELLAEWDEKNELSPRELTAGSHKPIRWVCKEGHHWQAAPYSRTAGAGCPYCANRRIIPGWNDLAATHPMLAREWDERMNGSLTPQDVTRGSNRRVWWHCGAGHVWQAAVCSRTRSNPAGCPICSGHFKVRTRPETFPLPKGGKITILLPNRFEPATVVSENGLR